MWNGHAVPAGFRGPGLADPLENAAVSLGDTVKVNLADPPHRVDFALERQPLSIVAHLSAWSGSYTYGDRIKLEGSLEAVSGMQQPGELTGLSLILDRKKGGATSTEPFTEYSRGKTNQYGDCVFSVAQSVGAYTYRMRFLGSGRADADNQQQRRREPVGPAWHARRLQQAEQSQRDHRGSLKPRHRAGSSTVMLQLSKRYVVKVKGRSVAKYRFYKTLTTKNRDAPGGSTYSVAVKLPSHGGWKIAWYSTAKSDPGHVPIAVDSDDWLR